jgi:hypothetical protein
MNITIKVLSVSEENKGKYNQLTVAYKDIGQGKVAEKKLMSFLNKEVYATIKEGEGKEFEVSMQKNDKGYWDWISIGAPGTVAPATAAKTGGGNAAPKSSYETAEERAKRQVMIVRQSSLSTAADVLKSEKKPPTGADVIALAKEFEAYVLDLNEAKAAPTKSLADLDDDIPY